jgi:AsmA protein
VTLSRPAVARLTQLAIRNLDLAAVLVERLCQPFAVTGRLDLDGDLTLGLDGAWRRAAGAGRFRIGPGKVVGADAVNLVRELAGVAVLPASARSESSGGRSPLEFDSITASYTLRDGVARTDDLLYHARGVTVTAAGTYDLGNGRVGIDVTLTEGANRIAGFVSGAPGSLRVVPTAVRLQDARDVRKFLGRLFR